MLSPMPATSLLSLIRKNLSNGFEKHYKTQIKIKQSFNQAAQTYDQAAFIQSSIADHLLKFLPQSIQAKTIADFGCGTGFNTRKLLEKIKPEKLFGIDLSEQSLLLAHQAISNNFGSQTALIHQDFNQLIFPENYLDLVFSNMAFQWSLDFKHTLDLIFTQLNPQGILLFSMPIQGTFDNIQPTYKNNFYELLSIQDLLKKTGFTLLKTSQHSFSHDFKTAYQALKSIKNTGAQTPLNSNAQKLKKNLCKNLNYFFTDQPGFLNYQIGFFMAYKK